MCEQNSLSHVSTCIGMIVCTALEHRNVPRVAEADTNLLPCASVHCSNVVLTRPTTGAMDLTTLVSSN